MKVAFVTRISWLLAGISNVLCADRHRRAQQASQITILHINDHHSHYSEQSFDLRGDLVPPGISANTSELRVNYGGYPRAVSLMKMMEAEAVSEDRDVIKVHAGDALTGTTYYSFFKYEPDAAVMNAYPFDAFVVGNHEFDDGDENLAKFISSLVAEIAPLSANVVPHAESALLSSERALQPYTIKDLSNGEKLGICGITPKRKTEISSFPDLGTTVRDEVEAATECVSQLEQQGINKIIILSHAGYFQDVERLAGIEGVDIVVGGDSHALLANEEDWTRLGFPVRGGYATMVNGTCIVQAWEYVKVVGRLDIDFDENGVVTSCTGAPKIPLNPDLYSVRDADPRYNLDAADAAIVTEYLEGLAPFVVAGAEQSIVDAIAEFQIDTSLVVATAEQNLCHTYGDQNNLCEDRPLKNCLGGSVCNMVAQGFLFNVPSADVAIQNRGGCRTSILSGNVTFGNIYEILPFSNTLVTLVMTGDQIKRVLEDAVNFFLDPEIGGGRGSYPYAAGLRYTIDYTLPFGSRINDIEVNRRLEESWTPLEMDDTFVVATNNFIAFPRDGYFTFAEVDQEDPNQYVNTFVEYGQSFLNYAEYLSVLDEIGLDLYSTQRITLSDGTMCDARSEVEPTDEPLPPTAATSAPSAGPDAPLETATPIQPTAPVAGPTAPTSTASRESAQLVIVYSIVVTALMSMWQACGIW